jgi:hypothetical protein
VRVLGLRRSPYASTATVSYFKTTSSAYLDWTSYSQVDEVEISAARKAIIVCGHDATLFDRILFCGFPSAPAYFGPDQESIEFAQHEWDAVVHHLLFAHRAKVINFELVRPDTGLHSFQFRKAELCRKLDLAFRPSGDRQGPPLFALEGVITSLESYFSPFGHIDSEELAPVVTRLQHFIWSKGAHYVSVQLDVNPGAILVRNVSAELGALANHDQVVAMLDRVYGAC